MRINIYLHHQEQHDGKILETLLLLIQKIDNVMASNAELLKTLTDLNTQLDKATAEILAEIQKLQDAINAGGSSSPEVDSALASVKTKVQALDDLNPDPVA